jgi:hypothetical protein
VQGHEAVVGIKRRKPPHQQIGRVLGVAVEGPGLGLAELGCAGASEAASETLQSHDAHTPALQIDVGGLDFQRDHPGVREDLADPRRLVAVVVVVA